jgi:hypothetical protein
MFQEKIAAELEMTERGGQYFSPHKKEGIA